MIYVVDGMNLEEIKRLIDAHQVISFDVFDTLLFRNVFFPTDIFKIVGKKMEDLYGIENFYDLRINAETESRKTIENGESNLEDIYTCLGKELGEQAADEAKKLELELELEFIEANPFMKECFDYAIKKNKEVIIISDMYLSKEFIGKLLKKSGYDEVPLYVSCEYKKGKHSGQLFDVVRKKENIGNKSWLHIGDNINSDYRSAIARGLDAYHYKNVRESYVGMIPKTIEESIVASIQCNYLYNGYEIDYWDKFGALHVSPIYFGFALWLYNLTKDKDNLFFLARDGYIIKEIYDCFPKTNCFTKYIYASRKSLQIPALLDCENDHIVYMLTLNNLIGKTLSEVFEMACLDSTKKQYQSLIKNFGFASFEDIIDEVNIHNAKKMVAFLVDEIKEALKEQHDLAITYLNQEGMDRFEMINVVDVGWAGSIQYAIRKLLEKSVNGYYFGTIYSDNKDNLFSSTYGWGFDLNRLDEDRERILSNVMMYELIFSAPHGTTLGYEGTATIKPILDEDSNVSIIGQFQNSAVNIIKKYVSYLKYFESIDKYFCLHNYQKFIEEKNYEDLIQFTALSNDFELNSDAKVPYVQRVALSEIEEDYEAFQKKIAKSLWKDAYLVNDPKVDRDKIRKIIEKKEAERAKEEKRKAKKEKIAYYRRTIIPFRVRKALKDVYLKLRGFFSSKS